MKQAMYIPFRRRIRFKVEALVFACAVRVVPRLPRSMVIRLSRCAGWLAVIFARRDNRIARANLDLAFGTALNGRQKRAIVREVVSNFVLTGLDYFWFSVDREARLGKWVVVEDTMRQWLRKGALVAVTAHFGNWEVLGLITVQSGSRIASVAKPVKNPLIDAEINRVRSQSGQTIVPREGAIRSLVRVLKEDGTVALLLDQDTLPSDGGVFVPFFGVPVPVATAAAGLALKLKVPILMAFCTCNDKGFYRCYVTEVFLPEQVEGQSPEELTVGITACLEREIRKHPGYWLWTYKRWKRRLAGFDPSRYPFYADC